MDEKEAPVIKDLEEEPEEVEEDVPVVTDREEPEEVPVATDREEPEEVAEEVPVIRDQEEPKEVEEEESSQNPQVVCGGWGVVQAGGVLVVCGLQSPSPPLPHLLRMSCSAPCSKRR